MPYLILGVALLVAFIFFARWFVAADPKAVAKAARSGLIVLVVILALVLLFAGRQALVILWYLLPFALPLLVWRRISQRMKAAQGPTPGQRSEINTRFLRMTLDHDSGQMDGEVREGPFAGRRLSQMVPAELEALWRGCQTDAQSLSVLEAYLDRTQGPEWREATGAQGDQSGAPAGGGAMSREEALAVLGLKEGAGPDEVRDAHRRLMQKIHPDRGGSDYLAAKINQAKDLLLRG